jgi:choline dehydrogenase-like flavoprotein
VSDYDVAIVGAGIAGSILAKHLSQKGKSVVVLEAGGRTANTWPEYQANVERYQAAGAKVPNSPFPSTGGAPSPDVLDIGRMQPGGPPSDTGYFVQYGPVAFGSDYLRSAGGTTLHWLGTSLRFTPADFELQRRYRRGVDWPITYGDLEPDYGRAEWEIGVSADVADQQYCGITFPKGYTYPMQRIPLSWSDQWAAKGLDGKKVLLDGKQVEVRVTSTPQGRNSIPNAGYEPVGAVGAPHRGLRCEGNSSCIPICPVQAKYNALKTLTQAVEAGAVVRTQCLVTRVIHSGSTGDVAALEYLPYEDGSLSTAARERVTADVYVLAGNAIENARLLLASKVTDKSGELGCNLMDHPFLLFWGRAPEPIGPYRGPSSTAGIEVLRDGPFRKDRAAFRVELGNWGWYLAAGGPWTDVEGAIRDEGLFGADLRETLGDRVARQFRFGPLIEQLPSKKNQVTLDGRYLDPLGQPRPVIRYEVDDYTKAGMAAAEALCTQALGLLGVDQLTQFKDPGTGQYAVYKGKPYAWMGAGHVVGTHRMGPTAEKGVVDSRQRVWRHQNLYAAGAGSMATLATGNPTLTLAALTFRTLDGILDDLGGRPA